MKIVIAMIDHSEQRYPTVGDWQINDEGIVIKVSKLGDFYKEICIAMHELTEIVLCMKRGISQYDVDKFDMEFEKNRLEGSVEEPGDSIEAPYRKEHFFATNIERQLVHELGIDWTEYNNQVEGL